MLITISSDLIVRADAATMAAFDFYRERPCLRELDVLDAFVEGLLAAYSATQLMAGQRQPDGRPLRAIMMAWMTCGDKQRCSRSPLCCEHLTARDPWICA